jgi:hypothetical protein
VSVCVSVCLCVCLFVCLFISMFCQSVCLLVINLLALFFLWFVNASSLVLELHFLYFFHLVW